jgi:flagellin
LGSTVDNLNVASENAASAESAIEDTDFASETANLTRDQILVSAAQTVLSQANARPQSVLSLLQNA